MRFVAIVSFIVMVAFGANTAQAAAPDPKLGRAQCAAAKDLLAAGERDTAKKLYVEATKNRAPCGRQGLRSLKQKPTRTDRLKDWLDGVKKFVGAAIVPLLAALILGTLLYVALSFLTWTRVLLRWIPVLGKPLRPRLKVGEFADGGMDAEMGKSIAGVVSSAASRLARDQKHEDYRLDGATGAEGVDTAVLQLGEVSTQFKAIAGILTFGKHLIRSARYELHGTVQHPRALRLGLTLALDRTRGESANSTLWEQAPTTAAKDDRLYYLADVAAGWADFRLRQQEGLDLPDGFETAASYGHFRAGYELQRQGKVTAAFNAYREALLHDSRTLPAVWNLARLESQEGRYVQARRLLDYAERVLKRDVVRHDRRRGIERRSLWYQVNFSRATQDANQALQTDDADRRAELEQAALIRARKVARYAARTLLHFGQIDPARRRLAMRWPIGVGARARRRLTRFLIETVEPSAVALIAGLTPEGPADPIPWRLDLVNALKNEMYSAESLIAYVREAASPSYRTSYNLACFAAERHEKGAFNSLKAALKSAPPDEQRQLADWARDDDSLKWLRNNRNRKRFNQIVGDYDRPPIPAKR